MQLERTWLEGCGKKPNCVYAPCVLVLLSKPLHEVRSLKAPTWQESACMGPLPDHYRAATVPPPYCHHVTTAPLLFLSIRFLGSRGIAAHVYPCEELLV